MAEVIIHLEVDPKTQKKNVWIKYRSDADALPMEHEEEHRRIVDQLLESGALKKAEIGEIHIERQANEEVPEIVQQDEGQQERQSVDQKG